MKIVYRKNGLYEGLVSRAIEGLEVEHIALDNNVTGNDIRDLFRRKGRSESSILSWDYCNPDVSDVTIQRELYVLSRNRITLDSLIARAIKKDLAIDSQKELCVNLFTKAKAVTGQPFRVIIITDSLEDHADSVENEADTVCQFWTDTVVQAVGIQPTMMSMEEYKNSSDIMDTDWFLVDRHVKNEERNFSKGMVFFIPIENLLENLVTLGVAPSGSWQDKAVEAIRSHILSKVNS